MGIPCRQCVSRYWKFPESLSDRSFRLGPLRNVATPGQDCGHAVGYCVYLKDAQRIHDHVGALLENGLPDSPEAVRRINAIIAAVLQPKEERSSFVALAQLLGELINEGYATKFNLNLFIKSQVWAT